MKRLWLAAAIAPLSFAAASHVANAAPANTTISNNTSTPVSTLSDGNITITGSVSPPVNTTGSQVAAVTINSNAFVDNAGTVSFSNGSGNSTAIQAQGGNTGLITNTGTITVSESTTGDGTNQNVATGPFANGTNRVGIQIIGPGTFHGLVDAFDGNQTNVIDNTGAITVIGENSADISIETAVGGGVFDSGTLTITGGNANTSDVSYGIHSTGVIGGNVTITGAITATGQNATGVALDKGATGEFLLQNAVTATGYRLTTASLDPAILSKLAADQVLQGGPGVSIGGDVTNGILIDEYRAGNTTPGNLVAANAAGVITVFGSAPALLIGGNHSLTVGESGNGYGLTIGGVVQGVGDYAGFSATGIQIGGNNTLAVSSSGVTSGSAFSGVTIDGGIDVTGDVSASAVSIGLTGSPLGNATASSLGLGNATAIHLGAGASTPTVNVSGVVTAIADGASNVGAPSATAVLIDQGATLTSLTNTGNISALVTGVDAAGNTGASGGTTGHAGAIIDNSGTLNSISNEGSISAAVTPIIATQLVDSGNTTATAIYLGKSTGNVSITQTAGGILTGNLIPSITGDVVFGSGNATLDLAAGTLTGATSFGNATDNALIIGNATSSATMTGALTEAAGGNVSVTVTNGRLFMTTPNTVNVSTLNVGSSGALEFTVDPASGQHGEFLVSGATTLADGAAIDLNFTSKLGNTTSYVVVQELAGGSLTAGNITSGLSGELPFLYADEGTTVHQGPGGNVSITVGLKTTNQLGLNPAEAAAYNAIYAAFDLPDSGNISASAKASGGIGSISAALLGATTASAFKHIYDQFLPDYAGGGFETLAAGEEGLAQAEADAPRKMEANGRRGWVEEIGFDTNESANATVNGFNGAGFGFAAGVERVHGDHAFGVAAAFTTASVNNNTQTSDASQSASTLQAGVYFNSGGSQGLRVNADVNGGLAWFDSRRMLVQDNLSTTNVPSSTNAATGVVTPASTVTTDTVSLWRQANSHWFGGIVSAELGVSYQTNISKRFYVRPEVSANYLMLYEGAHNETGGGQAFDLALKSRTSSQLTAQADLVIGANLGDAIHWQPELTLGWRQIVSGGPGLTTASFAGGTPFTLSPNFTEKGGLLGRIGVRAGSLFADFSADAGGVFSSGYQQYDARAVARFLF